MIGGLYNSSGKIEGETPQQALKNIGGQRGPVKEKVRNATFDEIKIWGWDKFVLDIVEG